MHILDDWFVWCPFVFPHKLLDTIIHVLCDLGAHEFSHSFGNVKRWLCIIVTQSSKAASLTIDNLSPYSKIFPIHVNSFDSTFGKFITLLLNIPRHPEQLPVITASGTRKETPINLQIVEYLKVNSALSSLERKWKIKSVVHQEFCLRYLFDHLRGCKRMSKLIEVFNVEE